MKSDLKSYQGEVDEKLEGILGSLDIRVEKDSVDFIRIQKISQNQPQTKEIKTPHQRSNKL